MAKTDKQLCVPDRDAWRKWLEDNHATANGIWLIYHKKHTGKETIPYDETRNYTKRVLASFFAYSWLYSDKPVPSLPLGARGSSHAPVSEASRRGDSHKTRSRPQ